MLTGQITCAQKLSIYGKKKKKKEEKKRKKKKQKQKTKTKQNRITGQLPASLQF